MTPPGPPPTHASRRVVPDTRGRDLFIAVGAGLAVLGFVAWAVISLSRTTAKSGGVEGLIVRKEFVEQRETQVTVGRGGLSSRELAGEYILHVRYPRDGGQEYRVYVNPGDFASYREGQRYYFNLPKPGG